MILWFFGNLADKEEEVRLRVCLLVLVVVSSFSSIAGAESSREALLRCVPTDHVEEATAILQTDYEVRVEWRVIKEDSAPPRESIRIIGDRIALEIVGVGPDLVSMDAYHVEDRSQTPLFSGIFKNGELVAKAGDKGAFKEDEIKEWSIWSKKMMGEMLSGFKILSDDELLKFCVSRKWLAPAPI